jgi:hypothetical protein
MSNSIAEWYRNLPSLVTAAQADEAWVLPSLKCRLRNSTAPFVRLQTISFIPIRQYDTSIYLPRTAPCPFLAQRGREHSHHVPSSDELLICHGRLVRHSRTHGGPFTSSPQICQGLPARCHPHKAGNLSRCTASPLNRYGCAGNFEDLGLPPRPSSEPWP